MKPSKSWNILIDENEETDKLLLEKCEEGTEASHDPNHITWPLFSTLTAPSLLGCLPIPGAGRILKPRNGNTLTVLPKTGAFQQPTSSTFNGDKSENETAIIRLNCQCQEMILGAF